MAAGALVQWLRGRGWSPAAPPPAPAPQGHASAALSLETPGHPPAAKGVPGSDVHAPTGQLGRPDQAGGADPAEIWGQRGARGGVHVRGGGGWAGGLWEPLGQACGRGRGG